MQITENSTGMVAGLSVFLDKAGHNNCVVVVKGTFAIKDNKLVPAEPEMPLCVADVHYGDPGQTSVRYECDFAPIKPRCEVLVNASGISPSGRPIHKLEVMLAVGAQQKRVQVFGDRRWERRLTGLRPSPPEPFIEMPLVFERAFGGSDPQETGRHSTELRNPLGKGYHASSSASAIAGTLLPNLEEQIRSSNAIQTSLRPKVLVTLVAPGNRASVMRELMTNGGSPKNIRSCQMTSTLVISFARHSINRWINSKKTLFCAAST